MGATQLKGRSEGSGLGVAPLAVEVFAPAGFFLPLRVVCVRVCVREGGAVLGRDQGKAAGSG